MKVVNPGKKIGDFLGKNLAPQDRHHQPPRRAAAIIALSCLCRFRKTGQFDQTREA